MNPLKEFTGYFKQGMLSSADGVTVSKNGRFSYQWIPSTIELSALSFDECEKLIVSIDAVTKYFVNNYRQLRTITKSMITSMYETSVRYDMANPEVKAALKDAVNDLIEPQLNPYNFIYYPAIYSSYDTASAKLVVRENESIYRDIAYWNVYPGTKHDVLDNIFKRSDFTLSGFCNAMCHALSLINKSGIYLTDLSYDIARFRNNQKATHINTSTMGSVLFNVDGSRAEFKGLNLLDVRLRDSQEVLEVINKVSAFDFSHSLLDIMRQENADAGMASNVDINLYYQTKPDYIMSLIWDSLVMAGLIVECGEYTLMPRWSEFKGYPDEAFYALGGEIMESPTKSFYSFGSASGSVSPDQIARLQIVADFENFTHDAADLIAAIKDDMNKAVIKVNLNKIEQAMSVAPQVIEYQNDFAW